MALYIPNKGQKITLIDYLKTLQYAMHEPLTQLLASLYGDNNFEGGIMNYDAHVGSSSYGYIASNDIYLCTNKYNIIKISKDAVLTLDISGAYYLDLATLPQPNEDGIVYVDYSGSDTVTFSTTHTADEYVKFCDTSLRLNYLTITPTTHGLPQDLLNSVMNALSHAQSDTTGYEDIINSLYPIYYVGNEGIIDGIENMSYSISGDDDTHIKFSLTPGNKGLYIGGILSTRNGETNLVRLMDQLSIDIDNLVAPEFDLLYKYIPIYYSDGALYYPKTSQNRPYYREIQYTATGASNPVDIGINQFRPSWDTDDKHIYIGAITKYEVIYAESDTYSTEEYYAFIPQHASLSEFRILNVILPAYQVGTCPGCGQDYGLYIPSYGEIDLPIDPYANIVSVKYITPVKTAISTADNPFASDHTYLAGFEEGYRVDDHYDATLRKYNYPNIYFTKLEEQSDVLITSGSEALCVPYEKNAVTPPVCPYTLKRRIDNTTGKFIYYVSGDLYQNEYLKSLMGGYEYKVSSFSAIAQDSQGGAFIMPNIGKCGVGYMDAAYYMADLAGIQLDDDYATMYRTFSHIIMSVTYTYTSNAILNENFVWGAADGV